MTCRLGAGALCGQRVVHQALGDAAGHEVDPALGDPFEIDRGGSAGGIAAVVPDVDVGAHHLLAELHE